MREQPLPALGAKMIIDQTVTVRYYNGVPFYEITTHRQPKK
jgi:hypothetical protein